MKINNKKIEFKIAADGSSASGKTTGGKLIAKKIVYVGFFIGILLSIFVSTNFSDIISLYASSICFEVRDHL